MEMGGLRPGTSRPSTRRAAPAWTSGTDGQVIGFYLPGAIHISRGTEVERQDEAADTWDIEAYCGRVVSSANAYEAATAIETAIKHAYRRANLPGVPRSTC